MVVQREIVKCWVILQIRIIQYKSGIKRINNRVMDG